MAADDALNGCEADAGALELGRAVQALERSEELVRVSLIEADAVVADEEDPLGAPRLGADLDRGRVALGGELPRVAEEVVEHRREQARVAVGDELVLHAEVDLAPGVTGAEPVAGLAGQAAEVDLLPQEVGPRQAREAEQAVDELAQLLGGRADAREVPHAVLVELVGAVFLERLA